MTLARAVRTVHAEPPEEVIWREVGSIDGHQVLFQNVLVALYIRKEGKTEGGLIVPDKVFEEDRYQGKAGMVLKAGPTAFVDDGTVKFGGFAVKPNDWVVFRPSEGMALQIGARKCRLIADVHIKMVIDHPDDIY